MVTSQQFRAKAADYKNLVKGAGTSDDAREFLRQERNFTDLADNEGWVADNFDKLVHPACGRRTI